MQGSEIDNQESEEREQDVDESLVAAVELLDANAKVEKKLVQRRPR